MRTDTPPLLLGSAERKATTSSDDVRSGAEESGALIFLDITKAPNTEEKLTLQVEAKDDLTGKYVPITAFAASKKGSELGAGETLAFTVFPGAAETAAVGAHEVQALPLPRSWRVKVTHSGESGWTYSVGYQALTA